MSILKDLIARCGQIGISESPHFVSIEQRYALCVMTITDENGKTAVGIGEVSRMGKAAYQPATLAYNRARINAYREYLGDIIDEIPEYDDLPENEGEEKPAEMQKEPETAAEPDVKAETQPEAKTEPQKEAETAAQESALQTERPGFLSEIDDLLADTETSGFDADDVIIDIPKYNQIRISTLLETDPGFAKRLYNNPDPIGKVAEAQPLVRAYVDARGIVL